MGSVVFTLLANSKAVHLFNYFILLVFLGSDGLKSLLKKVFLQYVIKHQGANLAGARRWQDNYSSSFSV